MLIRAVVGSKNNILNLNPSSLRSFIVSDGMADVVDVIYVNIVT
jgi:hypothetical protein